MIRVIALCFLAVLLPCTFGMLSLLFIFPTDHFLALSSCGTYTVVSGDSLSGIATKYLLFIPLSLSNSFFDSSFSVSRLLCFLLFI